MSLPRATRLFAAAAAAGAAACLLCLLAFTLGPSGSAAARSTDSRIAVAKDSRLVYLAPDGSVLGRTPRIARAFGLTHDVAITDDGHRAVVLQWNITAGAHGDYYSLHIHDKGQRGFRYYQLPGPLLSEREPLIDISPDGRLLAFSFGTRIQIIDLERNKWRPLRRPPRGFDTGGSFSADGKRLIFVHDEGRGDSEVLSMPLSGGRATQLTDDAADEQFPVLAPGGRSLAYLRERGRSFELVTGPVGGPTRTVARVRYPLCRPDFSPDGRRLVFTTVRTLEGSLPPFTLWTASANGRHRKAIAGGLRAGPMVPQWTWSP